MLAMRPSLMVQLIRLKLACGARYFTASLNAAIIAGLQRLLHASIASYASSMLISTGMYLHTKLEALLSFTFMWLTRCWFISVTLRVREMKDDGLQSFTGT